MNNGGILLFFIVIAYFLPTLSAYSRKKRNKESILVINLFLGWTFLGWVVALAMAVNGNNQD